jgi:class 3 adenylate cyclase
VSDEFPQIRYADAEGVSIAYEVRGAGSFDVVVVPTSMASLMTATVDPVVGQLLDHVASFSRLIRFDKRGIGMSDPLVAGGAPPLEQQCSDVLAVMNTVGSDRAAVLGAGAAGCQVALLFAALHPDRVAALILDSGCARYFAADDYPIGVPVEFRDRLLHDVHDHWGDVDDPWGLSLAPGRASDPSFARTLARVQQVSASRSAAVAEMCVYVDSDVRAVLPLVHASTLIMFAKDRQFLNDGGQYLADHITDARVATLPGADAFPSPNNVMERMALIQEFLTGRRPAEPSDRVLAAVLFTDVVASTERVAALGDRAWRDLLDHYRVVVHNELHRFRGRVINTRGDDFLMTFDGPARAIRCAFAISAAVARLDLQVRSGVHTGEIELMGNDIGGIAVHIGARVCALAGPDEVLVTSTVRDLVAGSGLTFVERGQHTLKGVPGEWTLLAVEP